MTRKEFLRKYYYELFKKFRGKESNLLYSALTRNVRIFLKHRKVRKALIYDAMGSELPVERIFKEFKLDNYFPVIHGDYLLARSVKTGRLEPVFKMDIVIVPGLFVNTRGYRLGRGRGYYDRLLCFFPRYKTVFIGRSWQVIDELPIDTWDKRVGFYITEDKIRQCI